MDLTISLKKGTLNLRVSILCETAKGFIFEKFQNSFYSPVGGRIKIQEDSYRAAKREFYEELEIDSPELKFFGIIENFFIMNNIAFHEINFVYQTRIEKIEKLPTNMHCLHEKEIENMDIRPQIFKRIITSDIITPFHFIIND